MRTPTTFLLALTLWVSACAGGSSDAKEAGYGAFQSGEFTDSARHFERALAQRSPDSADFVEIAVAHCLALAHFDPDLTQATFLGLGERVTDKDYSLVVAELVSVKEFETAIDILEAGIRRFPKSTKLQQIKAVVGARLAKANQASDNPEAIAIYERLKAIPYLGGGD